MSIHGLAAIAVRLTGIVIGLYAVKSGAASIYLALQVNRGPELWMALTPTIAMVAAAVCMIAFPSLIAGNLLPAGDATPDTKPPSEIDFEGLACTLVGLYFLVHAAMDMTYLVSFWLAAMQLENGWVWTEHFIAMAATTVAELIVAVWLLFRARGLMALLRWTRNYDTRTDDRK